MSSHFEKFVQENRDEFDHEIPKPEVWEKIKFKMMPEKEKPAIVRRGSFKIWLSVAATALIMMVVPVILKYSKKENAFPEVATSNPGQKMPEPVKPNIIDSANGKSSVISKPEIVVSNKQKYDEPASTPALEGNKDNKEMYYYSKLIEIKQEELKTLEKDEPLLYRQFSGDVEKLGKVYDSLKKQLPDNSNPEQLMEAMISNLQLQMNLLNKQLNIIKQIKHSKKSAYENAYKSI